MKKIKLFILCWTLLHPFGILMGSTPYDSFTNECDQRKINELPISDFIIQISDSSSVAKILTFNLNTLTYTLKSEDGTVIAEGHFSESDTKFLSIDPMAEDFIGNSPYLYCLGNPISYIDPSGLSTEVILQEDGNYMVVGGNLHDDDMNIYVGKFVDGCFVRESVLGTTPVISSFYNSDDNNHKGAWMKGSIINPHDTSGEIFLNKIINDTPNLIEYAANARGEQLYDFKRTNYNKPFINGKEFYRGMPMGIERNSLPMYSSARDIGRILQQVL